MTEKIAPDPAFEGLLSYIQVSRGLDFRGYKRTSLRRRIALRMEAAGVETFAAYQAHLEAEPREFSDLLDTVLINVTSFFRDQEGWDFLASDIIPALLAQAENDGPIRVWSVGCASGQEPYSIAMLFAEHLGIQQFGERVKIYATDLDEDALRTARQATYTPREVEGIRPDLLEKYFIRTSNHYLVQRELRKSVIFGGHNVVRDAPISRIDLLVCRNLLIYLESDTQDIVLPRMHYALNPNGFLFLGKAETQLAQSQLFKPVEMRHRIFSKVTHSWRRANGSALASGREFRTENQPSNERLLQAVLNESTTAFLVVDQSGVVTLANSTARNLLSVSDADIGRPFQDLPISYRPLELRGPIEQVLDNSNGIRLEHQEYHLPSNDLLRLTIEIRALRRPDGRPEAALLSFTDSTRLYTLQRELQTAQENLENSIEELQSANEELETTNEELQSTNEELETTNEELQSTNEELETINEESRSSNEEMESANEELRIQNDQASMHRLHLESVLRSLGMGVVVLDARHVVQGWNRWSENTWGLRAEEVVGCTFESLDIGFPVHQLKEGFIAAQSNPDLQQERVIDGLDRRGRRILCKVRIASLQGDTQHAGGVILAFEDITEERRREEFTRRLGRVMGRALNEIYFLDPESFGFVLVNAGAEKKLGYSANHLLQMSLLDFLVGTTREDIDAVVAPLLSREKSEAVIETRIQSATGRNYPAEICLQYFPDETPPMLAAIVHDTTERQALKGAAQRS